MQSKPTIIGTVVGGPKILSLHLKKLLDPTILSLGGAENLGEMHLPSLNAITLEPLSEANQTLKMHQQLKSHKT